MLALDIKNYIKARKHASIAEIILHFSISEEHVMFLLRKFIKNGKMKHFKPDLQCATSSCHCTTCVIDALEIVSWR